MTALRDRERHDHESEHQGVVVHTAEQRQQDEWVENGPHECLRRIVTG